MFDLVGAAIAAAIDFLSTEFKTQSLELLPHFQQVVPLSYFFSKVNTPIAVQVETLKKWFWKTSFSRRYSAQTNHITNSDVSFMKYLASGLSARISSY
jgi:hypothetical protein